MARVALAGVLLTSVLILSAGLVVPAPQVDAAYVRLLALSTVCELALWGALVLVIGRALSASAIVVLLTAVVIIVSILKYEYTGTVALPVDVFAAVGVVYDLTTFAAYLGRYIPEAAGLGVLASLVAVGRARETPIMGWLRRSFVIRLFCAAAIVAMFVPLTSRNTPVQRVFRAAGAALDGVSPNDSVAKMGLFAHMVVSAPAFFPDLPMDYGDASMFRDYVRSLPPQNPSISAGSALPNIVMVLSESLFDPRRLNVTIEPPPLMELDALAAGATYSGVLTVETVGGGTVRAEYSVLTGIPTSILGQGGHWPF